MKSVMFTVLCFFVYAIAGCNEYPVTQVSIPADSIISLPPDTSRINSVKGAKLRRTFSNVPAGCFPPIGGSMETPTKATLLGCMLREPYTHSDIRTAAYAPAGDPTVRAPETKRNGFPFLLHILNPEKKR